MFLLVMEFPRIEEYVEKYGGLKGTFMYEADRMIERYTNSKGELIIHGFLEEFHGLAGKFKDDWKNTMKVKSHSIEG